METKSRRPVTGEHPIVKAATTVLRDIGGPAKVTRIFALANEAGLLPDSAHNTIRGRLSQHMQHACRDGNDPVVRRLPKRRGWMRATGSLRRTRVTLEWLENAHAPRPLIELVRELGTSPTLLKVLCERLDIGSLSWLLETLPFEPELRNALRGAGGRTNRRGLLRGA